MTALSNWPRNRLLLALPSRNLKLLLPELEQIRCQRGQILMDADSPLSHVFFPNSGVVSVVAVYSDGCHRDGNNRSGGLHGRTSHPRCQKSLCPASRPNPRDRSKDVARSFHKRDGVVLIRWPSSCSSAAIRSFATACSLLSRLQIL
jgi:hypothetical protein